MSRLHVLGSASVSIKSDWPVGINVSSTGIVDLILAADQDANRPLKLTVVFLPPNFSANSLDPATMLQNYPKTETVDVSPAETGIDTRLSITKSDLNPGNYNAVAIGEFA